MPPRSRQPSVTFTLWRLGHYYVRLLPQIRRCLQRWERRAQTIPSAALRRDAIETLTQKATYVEAAAAFATLAAPTSRPAAIDFIVAWQAISDYVDALGEQPSCDPFANNMQLHRALLAAVDPEQPPADYYAHHQHADDGGYLDALVTTCRQSMRALPLGGAVQQIATVAAERCREAQSHVHATEQGGSVDALQRWTAAQTRTNGYDWWAVAAAGISGIAIPPLVAAAANPTTTSHTLTLIHDVYWPHVCALSVLLDRIADHDTDADEFSVLARHATLAELAAALAKAAANASRAASVLPDAAAHHMIIASTIAYYLTESRADPRVTATLQPVYDELRPTTTTIALALRTRQRLHRSA